MARTPELRPQSPIHVEDPWAQQGDALTGAHRPLSRAAKQSSTKPPLLTVFGSISSTAAWAWSQVSQCSHENKMFLGPWAHASSGVTASHSPSAVPCSSGVTTQWGNRSGHPHAGSGGSVRSPREPQEVQTHSCSTQPRCSALMVLS